MSVDLNVIFDISLVIWAELTVFLHFRFLAKQREYLEQFPPEQGIPLPNMFLGHAPFNLLYPELWRVMLCRQSSPGLERLRRATWRSYRLLALWGYGFPLSVIAILVLLGAAGLAHYW